jgi:predicted nucleic acid-binding protein
MTTSPSPSAPERLVINTGPLISLGRVGALDLVAQLPIAFVAPQEVAAEIDAGAVRGHPVTRPAWLQVVALREPVGAVAVQALDEGEAAVVQLALELGIPDVCIDEWRGRRAARAVGLRVTGSLGLLGRAKRAGLIELVRPWTERLAAVGARYHPDLLRRFLASCGE